MIRHKGKWLRYPRSHFYCPKSPGDRYNKAPVQILMLGRFSFYKLQTWAYSSGNQNLPQHPCGVIGENPFEKWVPARLCTERMMINSDLLSGFFRLENTTARQAGSSHTSQTALGYAWQVSERNILDKVHYM